jgi:hypothetical protein
MIMKLLMFLKKLTIVLIHVSSLSFFLLTTLKVIKKKFALVGVPLEATFINKVPHEVVPNYLSAADLAFSTIRPALVESFVVPLKTENTGQVVCQF